VEYVKAAAKRRQLIQSMKDVAAASIRSEGYDDVLGVLHARIDQLDGAELNPDVETPAELDDLFWHEVANPDDRPAVVPTPWAGRNELLSGGGMAKGGLLTVAAESGGGKSVFMVDYAVAAALDGYAVGYVSLEMTGRELWDRALAYTSQEKLSPIAERRIA